MKITERYPSEIKAAIEECHELLDEALDVKGEIADPGAIPSLMQQVTDLLSDSRKFGRKSVGILHHFACVGGTLISRCVAAMPNTCVLSEVDPLSTYGLDTKNPVFSPTDLLRHLRYSARPFPQDMLVDIYRSAMIETVERSARIGMQIVVRDHSHSHFCTFTDPASRPTHLDILKASMDVHPVLSVRQPIESFISLRKQNWESYAPRTFDEYCRRYHLFLDAHEGVPVMKYEEFVEDPEHWILWLCDQLGLDYAQGAESLIPAIRLTGDSGRGGGKIESRPAKPVPEPLAREADESENYARLIDRLGY